MNKKTCNLYRQIVFYVIMESIAVEIKSVIPVPKHFWSGSAIPKDTINDDMDIPCSAMLSLHVTLSAMVAKASAALACTDAVSVSKSAISVFSHSCS